MVTQVIFDKLLKSNEQTLKDFMISCKSTKLRGDKNRSHFINPIRPGVYFEHLRKLRFPKKIDNEIFF